MDSNANNKIDINMIFSNNANSDANGGDFAINNNNTASKYNCFNIRC